MVCEKCYEKEGDIYQFYSGIIGSSSSETYISGDTTTRTFSTRYSDIKGPYNTCICSSCLVKHRVVESLITGVILALSVLLIIGCFSTGGVFPVLFGIFMLIVSLMVAPLFFYFIFASKEKCGDDMAIRMLTKGNLFNGFKATSADGKTRYFSRKEFSELK